MSKIIDKVISRELGRVELAKPRFEILDDMEIVIATADSWSDAVYAAVKAKSKGNRRVLIYDNRTGRARPFEEGHSDGFDSTLSATTDRIILAAIDRECTDPAERAALAEVARMSTELADQVGQAEATKYPNGKAAWKWKGKLYPRASFPSGTRTEDGLVLDLQTGEVSRG